MFLLNRQKKACQMLQRIYDLDLDDKIDTDLAVSVGLCVP